MVQVSEEKLEHTGPPEKERVASVPQREQLASTPEPPFAKRRRNRAVCPEYQIMREERVKWVRGRGIRAGAWRGKGGLCSEGRQIPRRKERASKKSLLRRSRRKHEEMSGLKSSPGQSAKF